MKKGEKMQNELKKRLSEIRLKRKRKMGYLNSLETRKKISEAMKGKPSHRKGKKLTKEQKEKMSLMRLGKHYSPKTEFKKGMIPWDKGKEFYKKIYSDCKYCGDNFLHPKKQPKKIYCSRLCFKKSISLRTKGNKFRQGMKLSQETKKKISQTNKRKGISPPKGARAKQVIPIKDTLIEVKIQNFLKQFHLEFYTHQYMHINHGYQSDIFIPKQETEGVIISKKTVIECDGCYWHGCPVCNLKKYNGIEERKRIDKKRTKELEKKGFRVIRIWEHEIRAMELNDFKGIIN